MPPSEGPTEMELRRGDPPTGKAVVLNERQRGAVSWYFDPDNEDGEPWPLDEPVYVDVVDGQLVLNDCYLHSDGEWATYSEKVGPSGPQDEHDNELTEGDDNG